LKNKKYSEKERKKLLKEIANRKNIKSVLKRLSKT